MRKELLVQGEYYHIYNRGVDKRIIFTDDEESLRFIHGLYIFNNFLDIPPRFNIYELEPRKLLTPINPYVEITAGCLMNTHFHLMVTPLQEKGVSRFLQKIDLSYTNYFNKRHERSGRLFASTFKAKHVNHHEYAAYLTQYIHLNPIDLYRTKSGTNSEEVLRLVEEYPWSSLPIYIGKKSPFSIVVNTNFRDTVLQDSAESHRKILKELFYELYRTKSSL